MTHYTIRNYNKGPDQPKSWVIEGRNEEDNDKWEVIDERSNEGNMKGKGNSHTFGVQNSKNSFCYIRMRSTGVDWCNDNYLCINAIEFYGILFI